MVIAFVFVIYYLNSQASDFFNLVYCLIGSFTGSELCNLIIVNHKYRVIFKFPKNQSLKK